MHTTTESSSILNGAVLSKDLSNTVLGMARESFPMLDWSLSNHGWLQSSIDHTVVGIVIACLKDQTTLLAVPLVGPAYPTDSVSTTAKMENLDCLIRLTLWQGMARLEQAPLPYKQRKALIEKLYDALVR